MTKTLEMLGEPSVQRISVSSEMEQWWRDEVGRSASTSSRSSSSPPGHEAALETLKAGEKDVRERGDSGTGEAQWGNTLPGHGGT